MLTKPFVFCQRAFVAVIIWSSAIQVLAQEEARPEVPRFDLEELSKPPAFGTAAGFNEPGVRAVFYDSVPYRGKPTKVCAYYGLPSQEVLSKEGSAESPSKFPGVVLIHGGGGNAFAEWVRLWNRRGYAAIAMDVCGCVCPKVPMGTGNGMRREGRRGGMQVSTKSTGPTRINGSGTPFRPSSWGTRFWRRCQRWIRARSA